MAAAVLAFLVLGFVVKPFLRSSDDRLTAALCASLTLLGAGAVAAPAFGDALPSEAAPQPHHLGSEGQIAVVPPG